MALPSYRDRVYDKHHQTLEWWAQHFDGDVPERFGLESPILDVGCGTGEKAALWATRGYSVTGFDIADYCIGVARRHWGKAEEDVRNRLHFVQGDIREAWPFADRHFQSVFCSDVLEHLPEVHNRHFFQEIVRVLRPGGRTLVIVPLGMAYDNSDHIQRFEPPDFKPYGREAFADYQITVEHERLHFQARKEQDGASG